MSEENMLMTLGKVIIAVAWADGQVTREEVNSLKTLLLRLPKLSAREWARLEMYIETPVDEAERNRLVEELRQSISSQSDKELVRTALQDMVHADDVVTADEQQVMAEISAAIDSVEVGAMGGLFQLVKDMVGRQSQATADAPNREQYFEDFVKNKVYYSVQRRLELNEGELKLSDDKLRKLSLAGGIMARVARVDEEVTETEFNQIVEVLQAEWKIPREEATFVAEVAVSDTAAEMDRFYLIDGFMKVCSSAELIEFLDVLFAVAAADAEISYDETEEVRSIATAFNLPHKYFIKAKLKATESN
ncbi:MAG: TerB family tellurite resistance protein [Anaerolineae bacterium]|nr:TerB family tellurite resistance protein [Anaerolineae bacterium]